MSMSVEGIDVADVGGPFFKLSFSAVTSCLQWLCEASAYEGSGYYLF